MHLAGSPIDFIFAFLGGVLMSFTPCVYPLMPVCAGYIGANSAQSRLRGFSLSLAYVTGMAITFSCLGLVASLTGKLFGEISSYPLTYIIVGVTIVIFALSLFDIFHLALPNICNGRLQKKQGYFFAFFLGLTSGLVTAPCLTPALGAILAYLATKKNILYGMALLFSFSYGMGLVLILIGTFSSLILGLPKPGKWLVWVRNFAGMLVLITGAYFIYSGIRRM